MILEKQTLSAGISFPKIYLDLNSLQGDFFHEIHKIN